MSPVYSSKKLLRSRLAATQSEHQEYMPLLGDPSNTARIQSPDSLLASASMNFAYSSSSEGVLDIDMIRRCEKWYKGLTRFWRDPLLLHLGIMKTRPAVANRFVKRLALVNHRLDESMATLTLGFSVRGVGF